MFNKTFFHFFFGFVAIITLAFGVMIGTGIWKNSQTVDNVAAPR
jgi:hypothetical protein